MVYFFFSHSLIFHLLSTSDFQDGILLLVRTRVEDWPYRKEQGWPILEGVSY